MDNITLQTTVSGCCRYEGDEEQDADDVMNDWEDDLEEAGADYQLLPGGVEIQWSMPIKAAFYLAFELEWFDSYGNPVERNIANLLLPGHDPSEADVAAVKRLWDAYQQEQQTTKR